MSIATYVTHGGMKTVLYVPWEWKRKCNSFCWPKPAETSSKRLEVGGGEGGWYMRGVGTGIQPWRKSKIQKG